MWTPIYWVNQINEIINIWDIFRTRHLCRVRKMSHIFINLMYPATSLPVSGLNSDNISPCLCVDQPSTHDYILFWLNSLVSSMLFARSILWNPLPCGRVSLAPSYLCRRRRNLHRNAAGKYVKKVWNPTPCSLFRPFNDWMIYPRMSFRHLLLPNDWPNRPQVAKQWLWCCHSRDIRLWQEVSSARLDLASRGLYRTIIV